MSAGVGHDVLSDITPEDDPEPYPYCGPAKSRPKPSINPYRDVLLGDFVLCRPCDGHRLPDTLCGLIVLHRLLIYPLVAIMGPLLWSGGHQCV